MLEHFRLTRNHTRERPLRGGGSIGSEKVEKALTGLPQAAHGARCILGPSLEPRSSRPHAGRGSCVNTVLTIGAQPDTVPRGHGLSPELRLDGQSGVAQRLRCFVAASAYVVLFALVVSVPISAKTFEGRRVIIDGDSIILRDEQSSLCSRPLCMCGLGCRAVLNPSWA